MPSRGTFLPGSTSRGEDAAVLRSFFSDFETGEPLRNGVFLEIGGYDGFKESNTYMMEGCLGCQGVLVEAQPSSFKHLLMNRGSTLNINMAACEDTRVLNFTSSIRTFAKIADATVHQSHTVQVPCAPLGGVLASLGLTHLDFASIDVEGAELAVLRSLVRSKVSLGVALVEVRGDGSRRAEMELLLAAGMSYAGQIASRGTIANDIINDAYVNFTHMQQRFPRSLPGGVRARAGLF